jgi:hypothetical protein
MARKTKGPTPSTDATIRGCLGRLRQGYTDGAGVLADDLEETGHPLARRARLAWQRWQDGIEWTRSRKPRRKNVCWEEVAIWHQVLRRRVGLMFGRKWQRLDRVVLYRRNPGSKLPRPSESTAEEGE